MRVEVISARRLLWAELGQDGGHEVSKHVASRGSTAEYCDLFKCEIVADKRYELLFE